MESNRKKVLLCIIFGLGWILLFSLMGGRKQDLRFIIYYEEYSKGMNSQLFFDIGEGYSEQYSCVSRISDETEFNLSKYISSMKKLRGDFSDQEGKICISRVEIRKNLLNVWVLSPEQIVDKIAQTVNLNYEVENNCLIIYNTKHDGQIYFHDDFINEIRAINEISIFEKLLFAISGMLVAGSLLYLFYYRKNIIIVLKEYVVRYRDKLFCVFVFLIVDIAIVQMGATFHIRYYDEETAAKSASMYWSMDQEKDFCEWSSVSSKVKNQNVKLRTLKNLPLTAQYRIDFTNDPANIGVSSLSVYYGIVPIASFSGEELYGYIGNTVNIKSIVLDHDILYMEPSNNDSNIYFDADFAFLVNRQVKKGCLLFCLLIDALIVAGYYTLVKYKERLYKYISKYNMRYGSRVITVLKLVICFSLLLSAGMTIYMAMCSEFNVHPDEWVTRKAIDYYLSYWIPPDIRSEEIADTFSGYGHTRLAELSVYYLLAGKVGYIFKTLFHCSNYYRVFNLCLYLIMCFIVIKNIWKESWLAVCTIVTPQLCYICSYATSDAWDYFCSFLLIYQIAVKNSMLNRALGNKEEKKRYVLLAFFGVVSALIIMGKANYYTILLLAFVIFLFRLIKAETENKKRLMKDYIYILVVFSATFMLRYSFNLFYYGFEQKAIAKQVKEIRAEDAFKSATPIEEQYSWIKLRDHGVPLEDLVNDYDFMRISFQSFCGVYGYMIHYSESSYYIALALLYLGMVLLLVKNIFILSPKVNKIECLFIILFIPLIVFASLYHSWTGDYQPQGRYLLPALIGMGYLMSKIEDENLKIVYIATMVGISILVPFGFYEYGILNLT